MSRKPVTFQEILRRRQREDFVGRAEELQRFAQNLALAPEDPQRRFVFAVSGPGGVGKTSLLRRFRQLAEAHGALALWTSDSESDVPAVLGRLATQLEEQGLPPKRFLERYRVYRQRRQELEADPEAPQGFAGLLGASVARGGLQVLRSSVPFGGAIADLVDRETLARQAGDWTAYLVKKLGNRDEVRLVQGPIEVLAPLLVRDLEALGTRPLALFFDSYERTGPFLDSFLLDLLGGRFGELGPSVLFAIAGQEELDHNRWAPLEPVLARLRLEPFTEAEARSYLARHGVCHEETVEAILRLSGRLPLLVATLGAQHPAEPGRVDDPTDTAVDRFLKWIDDPKRRQLALDAALMRHFNRDLLAAVVPDPKEAEALFAWLRKVPFVYERSDGWAYHRVVREQMLRRKLRESPQGWAELHGRLAEIHEKLRQALSLAEEQGRRDASWQEHSLEALYHRLCQSPRANLDAALAALVAALGAPKGFARRCGEVLGQAGKDCQAPELVAWSERLAPGLAGWDQDLPEPATAMLGALLEHAGLPARARAEALGWRGQLEAEAGLLEEALADLTRAEHLDPDSPSHPLYRGAALMALERHAEALAELTRAAERAPEEPMAQALLGETLRRLQKPDAALAAFTRALQLEPRSAVLWSARGVVRWEQRRYQEALADFDESIELDPDNARAVALRGETWLRLGRNEEALADLSRAVELDPEDAGMRLFRGETLRRMDRLHEALADFSRAHELAPQSPEALLLLGETRQQLEQYEEALADFTLLFELDPEMARTAALRGATFRRLRRTAQSAPDFAGALELSPPEAFVLSLQGETYLRLGQLPEAVETFTRALELDPQDSFVLYRRAQAFLAQGDEARAQSDLGGALAVDPEHLQALTLRAGLLRRQRQFPQALADLDRARALAPADGSVAFLRGQLLFKVARYAEAADELSKAIALGELDPTARALRAASLRRLGRHREALPDLAQVLEERPCDVWLLVSRGEVQRRLGRTDEALGDLGRALQLDPANAWALVARGECLRQLNRLAEAEGDLSRAIELDPSWPRSFLLRAACRWQLGTRELALADLRAAREAILRRSANQAPGLRDGLLLALLDAAQPSSAAAKPSLPALSAADAAAVHDALEDCSTLLAICPENRRAQALRDALIQVAGTDAA